MVSGLQSAETATLVLIDFGYAAVASTSTSLSGVSGSPEYAAPEVLDWLGDESTLEEHGEAHGEAYGDEHGEAHGETDGEAHGEAHGEGHGEADGEADAEAHGEEGSALSAGYGSACDMWSVGVTLYVLLMAAMPMQLPDGCPEEELAAAVRQAKLTFDQPEWDADGMPQARELITACMQLDLTLRPSAREALQSSWLVYDQGVMWPVWPEAEPKVAFAKRITRELKRRASGAMPRMPASPVLRRAFANGKNILSYRRRRRRRSRSWP